MRGSLYNSVQMHLKMDYFIKQYKVPSFIQKQRKLQQSITIEKIQKIFIRKYFLKNTMLK